MRYLILGITEARDETGAHLTIGGARLRALLTALALRAGRHASVADLVDDVWGDGPPRDAPAALQALVARLRRALGGRDTVTADPAGGYRLAAARDDVDLHRFTRLAAQGGQELAGDPAAAARTLRTALELWRGPALADLPEPGRTTHAAAAEARRLGALRTRIEADLRSGGTAPAGLLPDIEALIQEFPYDETVRAQQLRALRAAGRPADALAAYEGTRRALADALGTDPGPELAALHAELLHPHHPPHPAPPPNPAPAPGTGPAPEPGHAPAPSPGYVPDTSHAAGPAPAPAPGPGPESRHAPGPRPAPAPGPESRHAPAPSPGYGPDASHAVGPGHAPEPGTGHAPESGLAPESRHAPSPGYVADTSHAAGPGHAREPGHAPAPGPGHVPGPGHAPAPGTGHAPAPGQAAGLGHAPAPGQAAGLGHAPAPGQAAGLGHAPGPGPGHASAPGHPAGPGHGSAYAPGASQEPHPGHAPGSAYGLHPGPAHEPDPRPRPAPARPHPRPTEATRGNLRPRLTSFVGREPELAALREDLARLRLVTLTGPGGSGKTRLAEHAAAAHPETGWVVELARLDHPAAVPGAVLSALGLRENSLVARDNAAPADPATQLVEHCAHRSLLLVLDNCEHVIGAAAELAERLLTHCPGVRILATSREPLGVPGETLRPVEPLPPDHAHRLFAERGASARPGFRADDDPAAVAEICARLDGLPLAIELAAARLRLLTPRQIADRLDDRFRLLTSGARTVLPRQQTLRAVVDWSWDLLDEPERAVLRRLSVFAGGWDLAAAEAVCADLPYEAADVLGSLVDKSLVLAEPEDPGGPAMRYRMLETIHEYATERAAAHPAAARTAARLHAAHYLAFAEEAEPLVRSAAQIPWIRRVETELDNLRAALHTTTTPATADEHGPGAGQRLVLTLGWFWWLRNYRTEGAEWTSRALAVTPADPPEGSPAYWSFMRLQVLRMFLLAESNGAEKFRTPEYRDLAARIKEAFRRGDSPEATTFPGMLWPATAFLTGDALEFPSHLDESVANCRRHGGDWELGITLMLRTHVAIDLAGGLPTVDADLAELHEIAQRVGDRWTRAQVASAAGEVAISRGRYDVARAEYEECLRLAREVGAHVEAPFAIARIAETAFCAGDFDGAERLLAEADAEADRFGGIYDVSTFARLLSAMLALQRSDTARAWSECARSRAEAARITVPAQLTAGLDTIEAVLTAHEQGPDAGLAVIGPALAVAVAARCAERFLAGMAEAAAVMLADAGRAAEAVRALAAATAWRAGHPRSVPEQTAVDGLPARTRALLGAARHTEEEAVGAALSPGELVTALTGS
ncbi:BTAD domain-containing putative transcriptional regulator [Streptomyces sp. NPDC091371]|uniref:BTAD domain-containing putative transcriptional regulator n=1 Tax=Streptomyces sp. NPDC091371 TaxID=3155303 RepID=UPI0034230C9C